MKIRSRSNFLREEQGAAGVLTALLIIIFVAIMAIVIDLGHLHSVRNELQNAADAGALAGARALFKIEDYPIVVAIDPPYCGEGAQRAKDAVVKNISDGSKLTLGDAEVTLGWWDWTNNGPFTPMVNCSLDNVNAVKVIVKRAEGSGTGPVAMTLAALFGWDVVPVAATSIAAVGYTIKNCTVAPIAVCSSFYNNIKNNPGTYFGVTMQTSKPNPGDSEHADEGFWINPCPLGNPSDSWLKDWILGELPNPPCYDVNCVWCNTSVRANLTFQAIQPKLEDLKNQSIACNDFDPWKHECIKDGTRYCLEGWLITVPVLKANDSGDCTCEREEHDIEWKPIVIRAAYANKDKKKIPEGSPCKDKVEGLDATCMEVSAFPCDVVVQGEGGGTQPTIYATRPKLVWFDIHR